MTTAAGDVDGSPSPTPRLEVSGATVSFAGYRAVDEVDLAVAPGEVVAVLGPSGSGKSTLLRAIAGLQPLHSGRVALDGADQRGVPPHRRGVGLMFQDHALFPHRDVAANVAFGLRMQRRPVAEIDGRVAELLELVDLAGFGGRRIGSLSGGEQQRVALARALAPEPRLLLLDEPLGALDRALRDRLVDELRDLFGRLGQTVVAVTHDQQEAFALADRIVIMDAGRVLQAGPAPAVWARPATARVAQLLGFANLVQVTVRSGTALTPWGPIPTERADGPATALVREASVRVDADGPVVARVRSSTFTGDGAVTVLEVAGAPSLVARHPGPPIEVGADVRAGLDPAGVVLLDRG